MSAKKNRVSSKVCRSHAGTAGDFHRGILKRWNIKCGGLPNCEPIGAFHDVDWKTWRTKMAEWRTALGPGGDFHDGFSKNWRTVSAYDDDSDVKKFRHPRRGPSHTIKKTNETSVGKPLPLEQPAQAYSFHHFRKFAHTKATSPTSSAKQKLSSFGRRQQLGELHYSRQHCVCNGRSSIKPDKPQLRGDRGRA